MSEQRPFEVGDEVYLIERGSIYRAKIERVTKTHAVIAGGRRYRLKDRYIVGADKHSSSRIEFPTPLLDRRWMEKRVAVAGAGLVYAVDRGTPQQVRAAYAAWDKLEKEVNGE